MTESEPAEKPVRINKARLEFLVDGIFAIAMTLLVLELRVPDLADRHSVTELWHHLAAHWRVFLSFFISLVMLAMFWYRHQHLYARITRISRFSLVLHLVFIVSVAFFPFCASLFGRYLTNPLANVVYMGDILIFTVSISLIWKVAIRQGDVSPHVGPAQITVQNRRNLRGVIILSCLVAGNVARLFLE
jgi:uncharacterized membrane protein